MRKYVAKVESTNNGFRLSVEEHFLGLFATHWEANGALITAGVVVAVTAARAAAEMARRLELAGFLTVN